MNEYIDISWPIQPGMTTYKDRHDVTLEATKVWDADGARESRLCMNLHTGTHIDVPSHFIEDGATSEKLDLSRVNGRCRVLDCIDVPEKISATDLEKFSINAGERILLKTRNSDLNDTEPFNPDFVYLDASGAEYLAGKMVSCVGIDYLGIERAQPQHPTHKALLAADIPIIEGLRLSIVEPAHYTLACMPLLILHVDALPARCFLRSER